MKTLKIDTLVLGMVETNCYIISNPVTKEAIVVDPGDHAHKIADFLKEQELTCLGILLTHGHFDHILAVSELSDLTGAKVYAHEAEMVLLQDPKLNASSHIRAECSLTPDVLLKDGQELSLAGFSIKVIHTPGHTGGGVCYYFPDYQELFSGDTLFLEDIGRSDLPTGNGRLLVESIRTKLMTLEDEVKVHPGHGESTTIGHEKVYNFYLRDNGWE